MTRIPDLPLNENPDPDERVVLGNPDEGGDDSQAKLGDISGRLNALLRASGVNLGGVKDGDEFQAGARVEDVIRALLVKRVPHNYRRPRLSLSGTGTKTVEAGSQISPVLSADWSQRDAGALTSLSIDGQVVTAPYERAIPAFVLGDTNRTFRAEAAYEQGPVVEDNLGDPSPGRIEAGSVTSNAVTYRGRRRLFLGTFKDPFSLPSGDDPEFLRGELTRSIPEAAFGESLGLLAPQGGRAYTLQIPAGTQSIVIAYPKGLGAADEILYVENSNSNVINSFTQEEYPVAGAGGYSPIDYRVYIWNGAKGFSASVTYKLTI